MLGVKLGMCPSSCSRCFQGQTAMGVTFPNIMECQKCSTTWDFLVQQWTSLVVQESHITRRLRRYPGGNTQRRVCEFAKQVANRIYETMIIACVRNKMREEDNFEINDTIETNSMNGDINCVWSGKYLLTVESLEVGNCKYLVKSYVKYLIMKTCRGISRCVM